MSVPVDCSRLKSQHSADGYSTLSSHTHQQDVTSTLSEGAAAALGAFSTLNTSNCYQIDQFGDDVGAQHFSNQETDRYESFSERGIGDSYDNSYDSYPAWPKNDSVPVSRDRIYSIFVLLHKLFGFQYDSTKNMYNYFMRLLDSRASRMSPSKALRSLHADYVAGINSNYRKWYFGSQMDIEDTLISKLAQNSDKKQYNKLFNKRLKDVSLYESQKNWSDAAKMLSLDDCVIQLAIYLLIWGEANNVRFMPECICFIFKTCMDCFYSIERKSDEPISPVTASFLDHAITPLYEYHRNQLYENVDDCWILKGKDHAEIIGYDDINQTFWYRRGLLKLELFDKTKLLDRHPVERFRYLNQIDWQKSIRKTYYECRSWLHILIDFNRIWNIHFGVFWYFTCLNTATLYTPNYTIQNNSYPTFIRQLSAMSIAGSIVSAINLFSLLFEWGLVPRFWPGALPLLRRCTLTFFMFIVNTFPCFYIFLWVGTDDSSIWTLCLALFQFSFSVFTVVYFSVVPLANICGSPFKNGDRKFLPSYYFTNYIYQLEGRGVLTSMSLWCGIFISKFTESYFYLTLSLRDPVREMSIIRIHQCAGEEWIGDFLCKQESNIILGLMLITDLCLFFLDTYLWYIAWNTMFSIGKSVSSGVSVWTPWRNLFIRLPQRLLQKVFNFDVYNKSTDNEKKEMVYQVWNSIVISMYREHLISVDQLETLIYKKITDRSGNTNITDPYFFISQEDGEDSKHGRATLEIDSQAFRRLSFFAHSLSTTLSKSMPLEEMPSFSVLVPHYSEKIILSLQEVIRREDEHSNITMLEYLKHLYPKEWHNFVRDTKLLATENAEEAKKETNDISYFDVGFEAATPEYILRTRIWASLRTQTLYRTISGFMNYSRAIKLLFSSECDDKNNEHFLLLKKATVMAQRKFRMIVSLQKMNEFTREQEEAKEFLLRSYPELQIAYLNFEIDPLTKDLTYYSCLIDGSCDIIENGQRAPKYKIKLSGKPILGDGKSDNQNHAIIFCRGEYVQLIDANQDNYIEECLKIRNVLNEFEEYSTHNDPYTVPEHVSSSDVYTHPVAIVGTREYIFSENIGILGDVAAGKEQTFGTLFARTLAEVGGKLHYGHPDFLNVIFMMTRGGISKSLRGLHLNADIYAGLNALMRGGRIKHCGYVQCGKGRDLGFSSILNFTTKIGSGMTEQMLSREYFYLGTQIQLDRHLSFFYAHPGFYLNNVFIVTSIKLFTLFGIHLASLTNNSVSCTYNNNVSFTGPRTPDNCYNLIPVIDWIRRCVLSIFIVLGISFIPLFLQELTERGLTKSFYRIFRQLTSFSPMFDVFVCRVYSQSLVADFAVNSSRNIPTGRGFSTTRNRFTNLYSRFSYESFYFAGTLFGLLFYISVLMWNWCLLYFWFTVTALLLSPFWFNPNQFDFAEFFIDYKLLLHWLTSGNARPKPDSWISNIRSTRISITGSKTKITNKDTKFIGSDYKRSSIGSSIFSQIASKITTAIIISIAYLFSNTQNETVGARPSNSLLRLMVVAFGPIVANAILLPILFVVSISMSPLLTLCFRSFGGMVANFAHLASVGIYIFFFNFLLLCQDWNLSKTILGMFAAFAIEDLAFSLVTILLLSRELTQDSASKAWWTGTWFSSGLGWQILTQPLREYVCKTLEQSYFALDFMLSHLILLSQVPILLIPYIDTIHSVLLLWLKPDNLIRKPAFSLSKRQKRNRAAFFYFTIFTLVISFLAGLLFAPIIMAKVFHFDFDQFLPAFMAVFLQSTEISSNKKGLANYIKPN